MGCSSSIEADANGDTKGQARESGIHKAFVFIKPHALKGRPGVVEALVKKKLGEAGITVDAEGKIDAKTIDEKKYIDTHYGAIASKAVVLSPDKLVVPDAGKEKFQNMFSASWDELISSGQVYNAKDGAAKLGVDGIGLDAKWHKLTRDTDLIKFGGGFYCGKVEEIYIINGFYMRMRAAFTTPGEQIHWMDCSWDGSKLSWADFRGKILGSTNPAEAAEGSVRKAILDEYKDLGLDSEPDTGNNGVHASASPLEGLAERMNWMGVKPEDDAFGKSLIAQGIDTAKIIEWVKDPQVTIQDQDQTRSIFDYLEDKDASDVLKLVLKIQ